MSKVLKCSPPDKRVGKKKIECPAVTRGETTLWRDLTEATKRKFSSVQVATSPFLVTKAYLDNYDSIFRKA